jgi:hypothetical protein
MTAPAAGALAAASGTTIASNSIETTVELRT